MFVITRDVTAAKKVIATLLATAVVLWASGAFNTARAANVTYVYDLLSDTAPGAASNHTIEFVNPTEVANTETIVITFPATFGLIAGIDTNDVDLLVDGVAEDIEGGDWLVTSDATSVTLTNVVGTIPAFSTSTILIGTHATNEGVPDEQITNPVAPTNGNESYEIDISAGTSDSGHTRVVILDTVEVTAIVETVFDFTVYGNGAGETVNGTTTTITSSSTTIPFGILTAGDIETISQDLTVGTNARNGFVVTVNTDGDFESSTGADIDVFDDGVISTTPASWSTPFNNIADEDTWGHWGVTSEDTDTDGNRVTEFGADEWVGVDTTPVVLFAHDGPADETTPGAGSTTVAYQVEISPLQEAGDDYSTILTYVATPTF